MGVNYGPAAQLTPRPTPSHLLSGYTGTRNKGSRCSYCGGLSHSGGAGGQTSDARLSRAAALVGVPRQAHVPWAAEKWRGAGAARGDSLGTASQSAPWLAIHGPETSWDRPAARVLVLPPTGTPGNPGGWPGVPNRATLTSRGRVLPALATAPQPGGTGHGPAQDTPPAVSAGGGTRTPPRPRPHSRLRHRGL